MSTPSWGVAASVNEPLPLILSFIAHYLDIGASRVHLYLEEDFDRVAVATRHLPQVVLTHTTDDFFLDVCNEVPSHFNVRQRENVNHAYRNTDVDWLLHVDADEFLECPDLPAVLAGLAPDTNSARIPNGERAFLQGQPPKTIFGGVTIRNHKHNKRWVRQALNGDNADYLHHGFLGHSSGKSIVRTGQDLMMGLHSPRRMASGQKTWLPGLVLHHFDGLTALHWASKMLRYAQKGMFMKAAEKENALYRYNQIAWIAENGATLEAAKRLHDRLRMLPPDNIRVRERFDLVQPIGVDPAAALARHFAGMDVDISTAAFDAALMARRPDVADMVQASEERAA